MGKDSGLNGAALDDLKANRSQITSMPISPSCVNWMHGEKYYFRRDVPVKSQPVSHKAGWVNDRLESAKYFQGL